MFKSKNKLSFFLGAFTCLFSLSNLFAVSCSKQDYDALPIHVTAPGSISSYEVFSDDTALSFPFSAKFYDEKTQESHTNFNVNWTLINAPSFLSINNDGFISWDTFNPGQFSFQIEASSKTNPSNNDKIEFTLSFSEEKTNKAYYEYMNEITISLGAAILSNSISGISFVSGTAWFYKKISNLKFELITNYHVYREILSAFSEGFVSLCFLQDDTLSDSEFEYKDYVQDSKWYEDKQDFIDDINPIFKSFDLSNGKTKIMDICAITVDFTYLDFMSYNIGHTTKGVKEIRDKIEKINKKYSDNQKIITIPNTNDPKNTVYEGEKIFIGGYPFSSVSGDKSGSTQFTTLSTIIDKKEYFAKNDYWQEEWYTYQDQCLLPNSNSFEFGGGASGSIVLNEKYETIGIYWGGFDLNTDWFLPSFVLFDIALHTENNKMYFNFFTDLVDKKI